MSAEDIFAKVKELSGDKPLMVSLSGGNPAIQPLVRLIALGQAQGYQFALETQGSVAQDWFADLDVLTLSPKPPSSGMATDWDKLDECLKAANGKPKIALKIVIFDEADYAYAKMAAEKYPHLPLYLQPGNHTPPVNDDTQIDMKGIMARMRWLADKVAKDRWFNVTVLPQLHVLMWGNLRGV